MKSIIQMKERIQQIMDREGMTPGRFADSIGIQRSALSHILNGRNNPSLDVLTKVLSRFDYLSTDWLLFGKGPMFKHQIKEDATSPGNLLQDSFVQSDEDYDLQNGTEDGESTSSEYPVKKEVIVKEVQVMRSVTRIMLFYSDNTFENFIPETPGKSTKIS